MTELFREYLRQDYARKIKKSEVFLDAAAAFKAGCHVHISEFYSKIKPLEPLFQINLLIYSTHKTKHIKHKNFLSSSLAYCMRAYYFGA